MKTKGKLFLNTISVIILFLSCTVFSIYLLYTTDLKQREIDFQREIGKFMLSLIDERIDALDTRGDVELITDVVDFAAEYFDVNERINITVFHTVSGKILYPFSVTERKIDREVLKKTKELIEGEIYLKDRFGYFVNYSKLDFTFFIFTYSSDLFFYRNQLIYITIGIFVLFSLLIFIIDGIVMKKWKYLLAELKTRFEKTPLRKGNVAGEPIQKYGTEIDEVFKGLNIMIHRSGDMLKGLQNKLRDCLQQRENLKKLIILHRKYTQHKELLSLNEKNISEMMSKRQSVASLSLELVSFLEPINELYPQVITDELSRLYSFVKKDATENGGIINFSYGYFINVIYGAPSSDDSSFLHAIEGSKRVLEWIDERNSSQKNISGIKWELKMGLSYGTAVTGTVGDNYIVLGEVVEESIRMLDHAKFYGVPLATNSESELNQLQDVKHRKLDLVSTGHDALPEAYIYEVFLKEHHMIDVAIKLYLHGLEMFFEGRYDVAALDFKKVNKLFNSDNPSLIFLDRCEKMAKG